MALSTTPVLHLYGIVSSAVLIWIYFCEMKVGSG